MVVAVVLFAAAVAGAVGFLFGHAHGSLRSEEAVNLRVQRDAVALARDITNVPRVTWDVLEPSVSDIHGRAQKIVAAYDAATQKKGT